MSAVITFDSISPSSSSNKLQVCGTFPAGLIRGLGAFQFRLIPTAESSGISLVEFDSVKINGVELKGFTRIAAFAPGQVPNEFGILRRVSHWEDGSPAAQKSMRQAGNLIKASMMSSDLVAQALVHNTNTAAQTAAFRLDNDIAEAEALVAELKARRAAMADSTSAKLNGVSLTLVATLMRDGIEWADAFAAAEALVGEVQ
jgi:hypothetical protein